jgi:hypothetical protein
VARKRNVRKRNVVREFLKSLATDPAKLGRFIISPEKVMNADKIPKEHRAEIKNVLALEIARRLTVIPEAYTAVLQA